MSTDRERFLIIRLGAIGDIIHTLPCADFLKKSYPNSEIHWVVDEKQSFMLENNPLIDKIYKVPLSKWKSSWLKPSTISEIYNFDKNLQKNNYTWAFDLHGMFKSLVIMAFCGAKNRVCYKDYREFATLGANILIEPKAKRPYRNYSIIQRYLDLIRYSGLENLIEYNEPKAYLPETSEDTKNKISNEISSLDKNKKTIIFAPKTTWINKHWHKEEWIKLFNLLKNDYNIVFSGVKADLDLISEIKGEDKTSLVMAGKTNLAEYIELIQQSDLVISPDSSASHIAWGIKCRYGKPDIITIFCATSKYTFSTPDASCFPKSEQKCIPCHKRKCKKNDMICTKQVKAEEIAQEVTKLLTKD